MTQFVEALEAELADLERELKSHPAFVKLTELRKVRSMYIASMGSAAATRTPPVASFPPAAPRPRDRPASGKTLEALQAAEAYLDAHGKPKRTSEILRALEGNGIVFEGNAPQNTLSSILSKSDDFVSKGGHIGWALAKWGSVGDKLVSDYTSPTDVERQDDLLTEPGAQGREAGPGGGT